MYNLVDNKIIFRRILIFKAGFEQHIDKRLRTSVGYRRFDIIQLDENVVDLKTGNSGKDMLDGMNACVAYAERRTAAKIDDMVDICRNFR